MKFFFNVWPAHRLTPKLRYYNVGDGSLGLYGQVPYTQKCIVIGVRWR